MADRIRVNTDRLRNTADTVNSLLSVTKNEIQKIVDSVNRMNSMWEWEANAAFNSSFKQDLTDLQTMCDEIAAIISFEDNACKEYTKCEQNVSELIAQIQIH